MSTRTLKIARPHLKGEDVRLWQEFIVERFATWEVSYPLAVDGDYGLDTRSATTSLLHAWGIESTAATMQHGVSADLRIRVRNDHRTPEEEALFRSAERVAFRRELRKTYDSKDVAVPVGKILQDSWGWHPGVHDGIDLICNPNAALLAICKAKVIRADAGGWWGLGAPSDPALKALGDGIIILQSLVTVGPIRKGDCFGYGHAEHATVKVDETVDAGQNIGKAGFANAWHVHFMLNGGGFQPHVGRGDRDPRPALAHAKG